MTLARLIEAVEAGDLEAILTALKPIRIAAHDKGDWFPAHDIEKAFSGSLDAAKRLHDALLPGWTVDNMGQRAGGWLVQLGRFEGKTPRPAPEAMIRDNPARAWLLAILRAMEGRDG